MINKPALGNEPRKHKERRVKRHNYSKHFAVSNMVLHYVELCKKTCIALSDSSKLIHFALDHHFTCYCVYAWCISILVHLAIFSAKPRSFNWWILVLVFSALHGLFVGKDHFLPILQYPEKVEVILLLCQILSEIVV